MSQRKEFAKAIRCLSELYINEDSKIFFRNVGDNTDNFMIVASNPNLPIIFWTKEKGWKIASE